MLHVASAARDLIQRVVDAPSVSSFWRVPLAGQDADGRTAAGRAALEAAGRGGRAPGAGNGAGAPGIGLDGARPPAWCVVISRDDDVSVA